MRTNFRELCACMADELDHNRQCLMNDPTLTHPLADKARAALATEPEGPTDEEIEADFRAWWRKRYGSPYFGAVPLVSVIEWTRHESARYGHQPTPPADGEVAKLVAWLRTIRKHLRIDQLGNEADQTDRAAEATVLARHRNLQ